MSLAEPITGGCYCGAIRYESTELPVRCGMCHCRMCQRWLGAAAAMGVFFDVDSFRFTKGEPARFMTSRILERHYCADCGGAIGHRYKFGDTANTEIIFVGTLDAPREVETPSFYFGVEDHLPGWITLRDGVPQVRANTSPKIAERFAEADRQSSEPSNPEPAEGAQQGPE